MSALSSKDSPPPAENDDKAASVDSGEPRADASSSADEPADTTHEQQSENETETPPLPNEDAPPLPKEAPPTEAEDDGWTPLWDDRAQAFYFFNRFTNVSQWENPRIPEDQQHGPPGVANHERLSGTASKPSLKPAVGGYDPSIHGDYDPNADYAKVYESSSLDESAPPIPGVDPSQAYVATGAFNRFTGKWQNSEINPEKFNDENKSRRQMNAFFDVDAAANSHDGKSLKAERSGKKLSKKEVKAFKDKRREKKEEKRRAWLRD